MVFAPLKDLPRYEHDGLALLQARVLARPEHARVDLARPPGDDVAVADGNGSAVGTGSAGAEGASRSFCHAASGSVAVERPPRRPTGGPVHRPGRLPARAVRVEAGSRVLILDGPSTKGGGENTGTHQVKWRAPTSDVKRDPEHRLGRTCNASPCLPSSCSSWIDAPMDVRAAAASYWSRPIVMRAARPL